MTDPLQQAYDNLLTQKQQLQAEHGSLQASHAGLEHSVLHLSALVDETRAENERLRGIKPELPPYPPTTPDGTLPRYGLRWNGPESPLAVPMDDGYWTPYHMAAAIQSCAVSMQAALTTIAARLLTDINDGSRPDQWSMQALVDKARAAMPSPPLPVLTMSAWPPKVGDTAIGTDGELYTCVATSTDMPPAPLPGEPVVHFETCETCLGGGEVDDVKCPDCNGAGAVPVKLKPGEPACKTCNDTGSVQDIEVPYLGNPCPDCFGAKLPGEPRD